MKPNDLPTLPLTLARCTARMNTSVLRVIRKLAPEPVAIRAPYKAHARCRAPSTLRLPFVAAGAEEIDRGMAVRTDATGVMATAGVR